MRAERVTPDDENDWIFRYPDWLIGWITDVLEAVEYRWTPVQILDTERQYPGLLDDLSLEIWQRSLIKKQVSDSGNL